MYNNGIIKTLVFNTVFGIDHTNRGCLHHPVVYSIPFFCFIKLLIYNINVYESDLKTECINALYIYSILFRKDWLADEWV